MKTTLAALTSAVLLGAIAGAGGCVDNRASVQVQHVCGPPATCSFTGTCEQYIGYPAFDRQVAATRTVLSAQTVMSVYLQVANQLPNNEDLSLGRVNTNDAHVDTIEVAYEGAVTGTSSSGTEQRIPANGSSIVKVPLLISGSGNGEMLVRVRLLGFYDNGDRFEVGEFPITVNVCASGCAPDLCVAGVSTCPPEGEGQRPLTCGS